MTSVSQFRAHGVSLNAPGGRPLFRDLTMTLLRGERVAVVGRNGVGKSTLLDVLSGNVIVDHGQIICAGRRVLVPQELPRDGGDRSRSPGQIRRRLLRDAFDARPDFLLLDEPTHDLDADGVDWLSHSLTSWEGGLVVVSHDRRILRRFDEFFVVAESGCRHFSGSFDALLRYLSEETETQQERFVRNLARLLEKEKRSATDRRRRQRKKNLGRLHELGRCPSRIKLNDKRSYAQVKQGKRAVRREARLDAARAWAKATRRALSVELPLEAALPRLPEEHGTPITILEDVSARTPRGILFEGISLRITRQRIGITGPNGSGKTVLVEILTGAREPDAGRAICDTSRIGYIAQDSSNWCSDESLIGHLTGSTDAGSIQSVVDVLRAHRFPFALAERPLSSLSLGERLRAALICLWQRKPVPELLVLDEPTNHLDFLGMAALESVLAAWTGGLVVVSHDDEFMRAVGIQQFVRLGVQSLHEPVARFPCPLVGQQTTE